MQTLLLLSVLTIFAYVTALVVKGREIPYSISATYYALGSPWIFTLVMWATALFALPPLLEYSSGTAQIHAFIACGGILLVGSAPRFKGGEEGYVHQIGAVLCLAGSQIYVAMSHPWLLTLWAGWIVYTVARMSRNVTDSLVSDFIRTKPMFWVEVVALVTTYASVILNTL